MEDSEIGYRIRMLRQRQDWTQAELAQMSDLERKSIIRYENGQNVPGGKALASLARVFGVSSDYILGLSDEILPLPTSETSLTQLELEAIQAFRRARNDRERERLLNALKALVPTDTP